MYMAVFPAGAQAQVEVDQSKPWYIRLAAYRHGILPYVTIPQELADAWNDVMVEAVRAFHEEGYEMQPALDYIDDLSDEQVDKRIAGYQAGYDKEYNRRLAKGAWSDMAPSITGDREKLRYVFADLPYQVQRAVVSHWDRLHHEWLARNPLVHYDPAFGYYWLIGDPNDKDAVMGRVKMYEDIDHGVPPTEEEALGWERIGCPGGLWGWMLLSASRGAAARVEDYTAHGDYED